MNISFAGEVTTALERDKTCQDYLFAGRFGLHGIIASLKAERF